jgi:hypothetical protein
MAEHECCFDLTGDSTIDNKTAQIMAAIESQADLEVVESYNQELAGQIEAGLLITLLEFVYVDNWSDDERFTLRFFTARDADENFTDNLNPASGGEFLIESSSAIGTSCHPLVYTNDAVLSSGTFQAELNNVMVPLPPFTFGYWQPTGPLVQLYKAHLYGDLSFTSDTDRLNITQGTIGGCFDQIDIFGAINQQISANCACLGLDGDLINITDMTCNGSGTPDNCGEDEEACSSAYTYCTITLNMLAMDVDRDGDNEEDCLSAGFTFSAIPARITGMAP